MKEGSAAARTWYKQLKPINPADGQEEKSTLSARVHVIPFELKKACNYDGLLLPTPPLLGGTTDIRTGDGCLFVDSSPLKPNTTLSLRNGDDFIRYPV